MEAATTINEQLTGDDMKECHHNFNSVEQRKALLKSYENDEVCYAICTAAHEMMLCRPDLYKPLMDAIRDGVDEQYEFDKTTRAQLINDNDCLRDSKLVRHYIAAAMGEKIGKHIELKPINKNTK